MKSPNNITGNFLGPYINRYLQGRFVVFAEGEALTGDPGTVVVDMTPSPTRTLVEMPSISRWLCLLDSCLQPLRKDGQCN